MPVETVPPLVGWDWAVIVAFFTITLAIGLYFSRRAVKSLSDYFVAGRKMTWWVAGTSMVATSFAADTPLVISGWSRTIGLDRNWFWWGGIMGFMLCTFFYARLWRRSGVLTDVEFNELRYAGKRAAGLRMFHATYIAFVRNTITMGWVTLAMTKIVDVTLDIPTIVFLEGQWIPQLVPKGVEIASAINGAAVAAVLDAKLTAIVVCFTVAAGYTTISGMWGVAATDFFQFFFAMTGTIILAVFVMMAAGGPKDMVDQAHAAVREGRVHNKAPQVRQEFQEQALIDALAGPEAKGETQTRRQTVGDPATTASEAADAPLTEAMTRRSTAHRIVQSLVEGGFFLRYVEDIEADVQADRVLWWNVHGLDRRQVASMYEKLVSGMDAADSGLPLAEAVAALDESRKEDLGLDRGVVDEILALWEGAYLFSKAQLSESDVQQKLVDHGIIFEHQSEKEGQPVNRYRFADLSWSEQDLQKQLDEAGVENRGEILGVWRKDKVVSSKKITSFLPPFDLKGGGLLAVWSLVVFLGLQWWAGGAGDGFLAQRLFSCKDEKHSVFAMLWYNFAMFVMRPWPWIVVGVASLFLIPDVTAYGEHYDQEHAYVIMLMKYLPVGLKGVMVAALMAAYMSTISTHVNFGASYVVNDLYKRFIHPTGSERANVMVSQVASVLLAIIAGVYAYYAQSVGDQWFIYFEMLSGAGIVIPLRWYWWRVNAWTELSAMCASLVIFGLLRTTHLFHDLFGLLGMPEYWLEEYAVRFTLNIFLSAAVWLTVTFLTPPEDDEVLIRFYNRVRPAGWWKQVAEKAGNPDHLTVGWREWACWFLGVTGLFAMIFSLGNACFGRYVNSLLWAGYATVATIGLFRLMSGIDWSSIHIDEAHADQSPAVT